MSTLQKWALAAVLGGIAMIIAGIWTNDWRWIATGMVVGLPAVVVAMALSI